MSATTYKILRLLVVVIFGVVPSIVLSWISLWSIVVDFQLVLAGIIVRGSFWLLAHTGILIGTFTLLRYVFGTSLKELRVGMFAGFLSLLVFVISPLIHELFERFLHIPSPIKMMGLAAIWSMFALFPSFVFAALTIVGIRMTKKEQAPKKP